MTEQEIIDSGYKKYGGQAAKLKSADYYYAKMMTDEVGKKFQVVIYVYDYTNHPAFTELQQKTSFMPEVQIYDRDRDFCIDVVYHDRPETSIEALEDYFNHIWACHGKPYYEKWENT